MNRIISQHILKQKKRNGRHDGARFVLKFFFVFLFFCGTPRVLKTLKINLDLMGKKLIGIKTYNVKLPKREIELLLESIL